MKIDNNLINRLLYEEESVDLDFKGAQYSFLKATDNDKSELLKDILAFSNAWRRSDAYILIGVTEQKGNKSVVVGIAENDKLDDAQLQQFVNQKTQKPITFSYKNIEIEGKCVGVIHIPLQARPYYLKKDFGKLNKEKVYIKRGSSTDIAKIDEISNMGNSNFSLENMTFPKLELFFSDNEKMYVLPDSMEINSLVLNPPKKKNIPDYHSDRSENDFNLYQDNSDYYRELVAFTVADKLYVSINFAIKNTGSAVANDVRVEIKINDVSDLIKVSDEPSMPEEPKHSFSHLDHLNYRTDKVIEYDLRVKKIEDYWYAQAYLDKVQPGNTGWVKNCLYLGVLKTQDIVLKCKCYSDNLPEPVSKKLLIKSKSEHKNVVLNEIEELERERLLNSPSYKKFLKHHLEVE